MKKEEGHDTQQVVEEDEEESCQQIGSVFLPVLAHAFLDDVVGDHRDQHFHQAREAARGFFQGVVPLVPARCPEHEENEQDGAQEQAEDILGDGNVDGPFPGRCIDELAVFIQGIAVLFDPAR